MPKIDIPAFLRANTLPKPPIPTDNDYIEVAPDDVHGYIRKRFYPAVQEFRRKNRINSIYYGWVQGSVILFSAITTFLLSVSRWRAVAIASSLIVTALTTILKTWGFQEKWINYRTGQHELEREFFLYSNSVGNYGNSQNRTRLFVDSIESVLIKENESWLNVFRGGSKQENDTTKPP